MNRVLAVAVLASVIAIPAARAQETVDTKSVTVRYNDLNVGTQSGAQTLLHRVKAAARLACGDAPDLRDLDQHDAYKACVGTATANAIETVHAPLVASIAAGSQAAGTRAVNAD